MTLSQIISSYPQISLVKLNTPVGELEVKRQEEAKARALEAAKKQVEVKAPAEQPKAVSELDALKALVLEQNAKIRELASQLVGKPKKIEVPKVVKSAAELLAIASDKRNFDPNAPVSNWRGSTRTLTLVATELERVYGKARAEAYLAGVQTYMGRGCTGFNAGCVFSKTRWWQAGRNIIAGQKPFITYEGFKGKQIRLYSFEQTV